MEKHPVIKKIKILHIIGSLNTGGIETWLLNVVRQTDFSRYQIDFLSLSDNVGVYDDEVTALGGRIYYTSRTKNPFRIYTFLKKVLKKTKYDIVHGHDFMLNGIFVLNVKLIDKKTKYISHSHTSRPLPSGFFKRAIFLLLRSVIIRISDKVLACTLDAGKCLVGNSQFEVLRYGINTDTFRPEKVSVERSPKIKLLHIGRFVDVKNHSFLLDICEQLKAQSVSYQMTLIGDGELILKIKEEVLRKKLDVFLLGVKTDVSLYLQNNCDVFILPSKFEGLGIVLLEAQACGVPIVFSEHLPKMIDVITELVYRVPLRNNPAEWAQVISNIKLPSSDEQWEYHRRFTKSIFSIRESVVNLEKIYESLV